MKKHETILKKESYVLMILLLFTLNAFSAIKLPAIFSDNMVLKRESTVKFWGWDTPSSNISIIVSWNQSDTIRTTCNNCARFETTMKTPKAGGPYTITVMGSNKKVVKEVLIGEVWLCSGQSNMHLCINNSYGTKLNYTDEMEHANNAKIRILDTPRKGAPYPQQDSDCYWEKCTTKTASKVSLISYFFAKKLSDRLNIPIGIVSSSWGGVPIEVLIPKSDAVSDLFIKKSAENLKEYAWWPSKPHVVYNSMIAPYVPFTFSGVIWYQGESNVPHYSNYNKLMCTLIERWRTAFQTELPFGFVQIAPFAYGSESKGKAAYLREQQQMTVQYPMTGMVCINDLVPDVNNIHPPKKLEVSNRLANWALHKVYNDKTADIAYPQIFNVQLKGSSLVLDIIHADGLKIINKEQSGFMIADESGHFVPVTAKYNSQKKQIILKDKKVKRPLYVRYLFDDISVCTIKGGNGLPMLPYRNDTFNFIP